MIREETREKMRQNRLGKTWSIEMRQHLSKVRKDRISLGLIPRINSGSFKKGLVPWIKGKIGIIKQSPETIEKRVSKLRGIKRPQHVIDILREVNTHIKNRICQICKTEFHPHTNSDANKFCSRKCFYVSRKGNWAEDKNPNWKNGITSINDKIRKSKEYKEWTLSVYRRDNFTCRMCGIKCNSKIIIAHHILSFSDYHEKRFDLDNGITVCRKCHFKIHHKEGD